MTDKNVCIEPCGSAIETEVSWIKQTLGEFKEYYQTAHEQLIESNNTAHEKIMGKQDLTNGHIKQFEIWKSRVEGMVFSLSALGIITWLGKYIITWLEK